MFAITFSFSLFLSSNKENNDSQYFRIQKNAIWEMVTKELENFEGMPGKILRYNLGKPK